MEYRKVTLDGSPNCPWNAYSQEDLWEAWQEEVVAHGRTKRKREKDSHKIQVMQMRLLQYGDDPAEVGVELSPDEPLEGLLHGDAPLSGCEPFPEDVYDGLPGVLAETTRSYGLRHERDVCLLACLGTLSSVMPHVHGLWGNDTPRPHGPNLYVAVVASAAGGKGAVSPGKTLVSSVQRSIREQSERAIAAWEGDRSAAQAAGDPFDTPQPPDRRLWIPANVSQAFLMEGLAGQEGRGLIFSTEIDTWTHASAQDWGQFDDFARKAYHHESSSQGRKSSGLIEIDDPHLSLVLAGTPGQFVKLIQSPENGLYSRICLYHFDTGTPFQSQRPSQAGIERQKRLETLADDVADLYHQLNERTEPLRFELCRAGWEQLQRPFGLLDREVQQRGFSELVSITRRAALWAYRIAMILTVLRVYSQGGHLNQAECVEASLQDVDRATNIALTCARHSLRFARAKLGLFEPTDPANRRIAAMLNGVSETFGSSEAYAAAKAAGFEVSDRQLRRDLNKARKRGLIEQPSKRMWHKTDAKPIE